MPRRRMSLSHARTCLNGEGYTSPYLTSLIGGHFLEQTSVLQKINRACGCLCEETVSKRRRITRVKIPIRKIDAARAQHSTFNEPAFPDHLVTSRAQSSIGEWMYIQLAFDICNASICVSLSSCCRYTTRLCFIEPHALKKMFILIVRFSAKAAVSSG
ncbi:hypothetical protein BU23DRAFT_119856 [Bimuria novae-zelandiae CBS 107.79]|uniref:Uncharacterized protein n=1 Tax=Bimuria novae-zelandiae CBS 107.79 TaxID=1447943 RepID=A0A6A5VC13_9PLEO|nr:hypothetical protein BU23DRAFT_119856 [Bimuria novae-zelandiae CBS 107.79]